MNRATSAIGYWWRWRFHLLRELGWLILRKRGGAALGTGLMSAGFILQRRRKRGRRVLHRATLEPGQSIRIRVSRGDRVLSDRTIGS